MADRARKKTDQELKKLEREIYELYATASSDLYDKWDKYMQSHKKKLDSAYDALQEAKKSGDRDAIKAAQEEYERTFKNVTLNDERYKAMINETTAKMAHVNEIALGYVNDETPKVYTLNYNAFSDEKIDGYDFTLINENAVKNLIKTGDLTLYKHVDVPKDKAWNEKFINSQVLQGILQGESIDKIAKRVFPEINRFNKDPNLVKRNENSSIRIARTMVTAAENKGRQDSFKKAESDGVIMKRRWVATHDERTRAWHSDLDGQEVGLDEPWENDYGKIMYPGDPTADPANVYNCRCSIRAKVLGFAWNQENEEQANEQTTVSSLDNLTNVEIGDLSEMDETLRNQMLMEVDDILDDFEKAKPFLTSIEPMDSDGFFDVGAYEPYGSLRINTFAFSDYKEAIDDYEEQIKRHETAGKTPINLVSHECGHLLERAYMTVVGDGYDEKDWRNHKYAKSILSNVRKEMGISVQEQNTLISELSTYATEDAGEALAECISNYRAYGDDAKPLSIAVYEYLKKKLN